jgi:LPXTG-site transpeptidase (sortase) family protein
VTRLALHGWSRRHVGALLAVTAILCAVLYVSRVDAANQSPAPGWQLTAVPTTNLSDGQQVSFNLHASDDVNVAEITIVQCRFGPTYGSSADFDPSADNCPADRLSSSQVFQFVQRNSATGLSALSHTANGAVIPFFVGVGIAQFPDGTSLSCDAVHPCALVAKVIANGKTTFSTFKIEFAVDDPITACGGPAKGILSTASGDEMSDAWAGWTRALCQQQTGGAASRTAFTGEGAAVSSFAQGDVDLAYTGAGYDSTVALTAIAPDQRRKAVAVPVALNASVIAAGGGQHQLINGAPFGDKAPYPDGSLSLTADEAAGLLGYGRNLWGSITGKFRQPVLDRNPALNGFAYGLEAEVEAPSQTQASTYYMTNYLYALAKSDFVNPQFVPPSQHTPTNSLALAQPNFDLIALYTGRPALRKIMIPASFSVGDGPLWAMTDLASAKAMGITPVALSGAGGEFVLPTAESMAAAVDGMKRNSEGMLEPDPSLSGLNASAEATGGVTPYPLTYVMYALVPAEPLVDETTCTLRSDSQALLTRWMSYVTGAGQTNLPSGMQPLPPALQSEAQSLLATVGQSPVTGACAGKVGPGTGTTAPPTGAGSGPTATSAGLGLTAGGVNSFKSASTPSVGGAPTGANTATAQKEASAPAIAVPAFAGHTTTDPLNGVIALLGIVLLTTLGAWITAGGELGGSVPVGGPSQMTPGRMGSLFLLWVAVLVSGVALVMFQLGPMLEQRDQDSLMKHYKTEISHAANEVGTLAGVQTTTTPPEIGDAVGILEIGALKAQDVVVEGVAPSETRSGPGHVPGTSGLGQPGNSVVVARRNGYGGTFAKLGTLRKGDRIVVTTTQGQSVYAVSRTCTVSVTDATDDSASSSSSSGGSGASQFASTGASDAVSKADDVCRSSGRAGNATADTPTTTTVASAANGAATDAPTSSSSTTTSTTTAGSTTSTTAGSSASSSSGSSSSSSGSSGSPAVKAAALFGASSGDQLTLVTSASRSPINSNEGRVVVAKLLTKPFAPTPQGARSSSQTGMDGDSGAWATVALALLGFAGVVVASVFLYRKLRFRVAYLLTIAPLVALTIIAGEAIVRLLPAWS